MTAGDSFWGDPTGGNNDHLWVIMNDPSVHEGVCALLNFTTDRSGTAKYSVPAGYHTGITARSVICYGDMIPMAEDFIEAQITFGAYRENPPFPATKLSFLLQQAKTVAFVPREVKSLL